MEIENKPFVSIGMPLYNGERYLKQALDSLIQQDYQNFELIITDNCSTDKTPEICTEYAKRYSQIKYYRNETNLGATQNFKRVLQFATGKYFMWAAHDDRWDSRYLSQCVSALEANPSAVLCCSSLRFIDEDDRIIDLDYTDYDNPDLSSSNLIERLKIWVTRHGWYAIYGLIQLDLLRQVKIEDIYGADARIVMQLCLNGPFCKVPEVLFFYRQMSTKTEEDRYKSSASPALNQKLKFQYGWLACELLDVVKQSSLSFSSRSYIIDELVKTMASDRAWHHRLLQQPTIPITDGKKFLDRLPFHPRELVPLLPFGQITKDRGNLRCALIEFNDYHDLLLPTLVYILNQLGIAVDLYVTSKVLNFNPFFYVKKLSYSICNIQDYKSAFCEKAFRYQYYDFIIFNSVEPKQWLSRINFINRPILGIVHNGKLLREDSDYQHFFSLPHRTPILLSERAASFASTKDDRNWLFPAYLCDEEEMVDYQEQKQIIRFIVQGNVEFSRRNYLSLLKAVQLLHQEKYTNFRVVLVGRSYMKDGVFLKQEILRLGLSSFFEISDSDIDCHKYYNLLKQSSYILPLIDTTKEHFNSYFKDKVSTSLMMCIGFGIIPILHEKLSDVYNIPGITYQDDRLYEALKSTLESTSTIDLDRYSKNLKLKRAKLLEQSISNFINILYSQKIDCFDTKADLSSLLNGVKQNPYSSDAYKRLGACLESQGKEREAFRAYAKAKELE